MSGALKLKLTYFNIPGRAEPIRLAFHYGGIAFEDERLTGEDFKARKLAGEFPYGQVPVLSVDGKLLAQSNALLRYAGKLSGTYPSDALEAAKVDEILDLYDDSLSKIGGTASLPEDQKKASREAIAANDLPKLFSILEANLTGNKDGFLLGATPTIADFKLYAVLSGIKKGTFDYIPGSLIDSYPLLSHFNDRIRALPQLAAHFAAHP